MSLQLNQSDLVAKTVRISLPFFSRSSHDERRTLTWGEGGGMTFAEAWRSFISSTLMVSLSFSHLHCLVATVRWRARSCSMTEMLWNPVNQSFNCYNVTRAACRLAVVSQLCDYVTLFFSSSPRSQQCLYDSWHDAHFLELQKFPGSIWYLLLNKIIQSRYFITSFPTKQE